MIPYIHAGVQQPPPPNPRYSNVVKQWANQNVCFSCGFDVEDWHNSSTCTRKKVRHQDGLTRSNYLEYKRANHQFCHKGMHKTMWWLIGILTHQNVLFVHLHHRTPPRFI